MYVSPAITSTSKDIQSYRDQLNLCHSSVQLGDKRSFDNLKDFIPSKLGNIMPVGKSVGTSLTFICSLSVMWVEGREMVSTIIRELFPLHDVLSCCYLQKSFIWAKREKCVTNCRKLELFCSAAPLLKTILAKNVLYMQHLHAAN